MMAFIHLQLFLTAALLLFSPTSSQTFITCPEVGTSTSIPSSTTSSTTIRIPVISTTHSNVLCTLVRANLDGSNRAPVARSYASQWEVSAGRYAKTNSGLSIHCLNTDPVPVCDVTLPQLQEGQQYVLETYRHILSEEATAARFLEQATFGTRQEDITALVATNNNFTEWVYNQIYDVPMSSHREFYRRRTNPKFEYPYQVGAIGPTPCEKFSRWRKYALTSRDALQGRRTLWNKFLLIYQVQGIEGYIWKVDEHFRTITKDHPKFSDGTPVELGKRYRIPNPDGNAFKIDCVGCMVPIGDATRYVPPYYIANPPVSIEGVEGRLFSYRVVELPSFKTPDFLSIENPTVFHPLFAQWIHPDENGLLNTTILEGTDECIGHPNFRQPLPGNERDAPPGAIPTVFGRSVDSVTGETHVFAYDPHLALKENTIENPLLNGGGDLVMDTDDLVAGTQVLCHNVEMNFLNEKKCQLSYDEKSCRPNTTPKRVIVLNDANLSSITQMTGRKLYAVTGFSLHDINNSTGMPYFRPPCRPGKRTTRWIKDTNNQECANTAGLGLMSQKAFRDIIDAATSNNAAQYYNPNIVDVTRNVLECDEQDVQKYDMGNVKASDGSCWTNIHPYEQSVFDLTDLNTTEYTIVRENLASISTSVLYEKFIIVNNITAYPLLGKFGDHVILDGTEVAPLDDETVQKSHKTLNYNPSGGAVLMCGSPNEVGSDPFHGDQEFDVVIPEASGYRTSSIWQLSAQRHTTWTHLALHAQDQLRQRVAWALYQIVSVGIINRNGNRVFWEKTEPYIELYDQFVRHAFGSYRDLMREFSYNVLMAEWLSFLNNKSLQWNIENGSGPTFPDENFAREIMQLFSIGLYKLNQDGSQMLSENGFPLEAYTMDDIASYSRAWTGFVMRPIRGGAVAGNREMVDTTSLDPMGFNHTARDVFPKTDLTHDYIGNRVAPLCVDLPPKHFLRKGASFRLLGGTGSPQLQHDPSSWSTDPDLKRIELDPSSPLFLKLCDPSPQGGECSFPSTVNLADNLLYEEAAMSGEEYAVDTLRTVVLKKGLSKPVFYEYVRQPCVEFAFFDNAKKVIKGQVRRNYVQKPSMCANSKLAVATAMCSESGWRDREEEGKVFCHYQGERMTYESAEKICQQNGLEQSHPWVVFGLQAGPCGQGIIEQEFSSWSNAECSVLVKISLESGQIAIVHDPQPDYAGFKDVEGIVAEDSINFFKAYWHDDTYPSIDDCDYLPSCRVHTDKKSCICETIVHESSYYTSAEEIVDAATALSVLRNGAVHPEAHDLGVYNNIGDCGIADLTVYSTVDGSCTNFLPNTIFSTQSNGVTFFLKNMKSIVYIEGSEFSFRNPSHYINMVEPATRDITYETEAVIDSLFYHPNHPTFLAVRMIQRFGISNPSPAFLVRVTDAYKTGSFQGVFGSGQYGDLAALVAAIILDPESRNVVLDLDQAHGHLREPLVKVLGFFRAMGLSYSSPLHIPTLLNQYDSIGQGSYETPSVFSFFLPEFSPATTQSAELAAPEAMVLQSQRVLWLIDSLLNTVKTGITNCYTYTFDQARSDERGGNQNWAWDYCAKEEGDTSLSSARATYWPSSTASADTIINELGLLLTSDRLTEENRAIIRAHVEKEMNNGDVSKAVRVAQELILSTPEFHATNIVRKQDNIRETLGYAEAPKSSYKVVVVLMMVGGLDSFNLLLPKGRCTGEDQYTKYQNARGAQHAVPLSKLESIYAHNQSCVEFGVNTDMDVVADLYNNKEALFFANTGVLSKPMTGEDWLKESSFQPFAHNIMQHEFYAGDPYNIRTGTGVFGRMLDILKAENGYQTAAYALNGGEEMLTGDPSYGNSGKQHHAYFVILEALSVPPLMSILYFFSVQSLSTMAPQALNRFPTIENVYDVAKQLNGIGDAGNSFFGETWASNFASALFDHNQMELVTSIPEFNIADGQFPGSRVSSSLKRVAENIRSREFRKVDREVYVVPDFGYDTHFGNEISSLLVPVNEALKAFIQELKSQGVWDDTVILLGSDFGRSLIANGGGGTDHAWGGHYFMAGGGVAGGQILGQYPDMSADNPSWIDFRGRFVPTTSWDAVFNGIANWFGVRGDAGLEYSVPNRGSFDKCDLFYDSDLFKDGTCTCEAGCPPGSQIGMAVRSIPFPLDYKSPLAIPENGVLVATVLSEGSIIVPFGCSDPNDRETFRAIDRTTKKFFCERSSLAEASGIVITPPSPRMSIVKGLRLYTQNNCVNCDVISFILEGRKEEEHDWTLISDSDLSWLDMPLERNGWGKDIDSSFASGDTSLAFAGVEMSYNEKAYIEYRLTFSRIRDQSSMFIQFAELELPGLVLNTEPGDEYE